MNHWTRITIPALLLMLFSLSAPAAQEVNIYSARKEALIKPLLDRFTRQTGIRVNLVTGKAKTLLKRIQSEGRNTPADLLLTTDAGNLYAATTARLLQPVDNARLKAQIPQHLRDPGDRWYALSIRSRVIVYDKARVQPSELSRYEELADPKWKGRICIRSSGNIYNQSLLASLISHNGAEQAERWARGVVANMARPPKGNDRSQVKAVAVGICDIAVINTYYLGVMLQKEGPQRDAASQVAVFFPNQNDRGAHINISGAGIIKGAKHRENAIRLLEFLLSDPAQQWYAEINHEYPVKAGIAVSDIVRRWGYPFKQDRLNVSELGRHNAEAVRIFDRAGWK